VEKYLKRCLDSVIAQKGENFRAIVVDDGSTDNCSNICEEYAKLDSRIIVYHKPNGGLANAVRYGIENSPECDYVMFLDGDDALLHNAVESVSAVVEKHQVDIVMYDFYMVEENERITKTVTSNLKDGASIGNDYQKIKDEYLTNTNVVPARWNKIFKKDVAIKALEYYDDNATVAEDLLYTSVSLFNANSLYYLKTPLVKYYQNGSSMTHKFKENHFDSYKIVYKQLDKFFEGGRVSDLAFFQNVKTLVQNIILSDLTTKEKKKQLERVRTDKDFYKLNKRFKPTGIKDKIIKRLIEKGRYNLLKILTKINNR
jgi:glycosyltransferase involved in cell wall biosynthesis